MPPQTTTTTDAVLGMPLQLTFESGRTTDVTLVAIRVRDFNDYRALLGKEPELIERCLGVLKGTLTDGEDPITPASYNELATRFHQLNAPFFDFCARQGELLSRVQGRETGQALERALMAVMRENLSNSGAGLPGSAR